MPLLKPRPLLGVEFHPDEVRIVELKPQGSTWAATAFTSFVPPVGYLGEFGIDDTITVGKMLRVALEKAGITTSDAVFGLPPQYCGIRAISVPPVEGQELRFIVQGEVDMARMFRTPEASFDVIPLNDSKLLDSGGRSVLVAGSELPILTKVRDLGMAAGLKTEAIEPTHLALYRAAYLQSPTPPNLFLTLSETYAEVSLLDEGQIALHRAFDLGTNIFQPAPPDGETVGAPLDLDAAQAIAIELRRTIDFVARELPLAPPTEEVAIACTHERAQELASWLQDSLRIPFRLANLHAAPTEGTKSLSPQDSLRYVAAHALTLRPPYPLPDKVPAIDLLAHENLRHGLAEDVKRKFRIALIGACVVLGCSAIAAILGTIQANNAAAALQASQKRLADTREEERLKKAEAATKAERIALLTEQGLETSGIIRSIVSTVGPAIGLTEVNMKAAGTDIAGETLTEAAMIAMSDNLRKDPRFIVVSILSFEKVDAKVPAAGMRFRMNLQTPKPPPATPAPGAGS